MSKGFSLKWNGIEAMAKVDDGVKSGLLKGALYLKRKSVAEAPIESGDLRANCNVDESQLPLNRVSVGYSSPYALKQHEELDLRHDRTDGYRIATGKNAGKSVNLVAGGKAKFLEDPYNQSLSKLKDFVAKEVAKKL